MTLLSQVKNITPDNTLPLNVAYYRKQAKWLRDFVDMKLFCHRFKRVLESNVPIQVRFASGLLTCSLMSHLLIREVNSRHAGAVFGVFSVLLSCTDYSPLEDQQKPAQLGGFVHAQYELHFALPTFLALTHYVRDRWQFKKYSFLF